MPVEAKSDLGNRREAIREEHAPPRRARRPAGEDRRRPGPRAAGHSLVTGQRYFLHGLLLLLALSSAGLAFGGALQGKSEAGRSPAAGEATHDPVAQTTAGYLRPPVVLVTLPGVWVRQQAEVKPTPTPTPAPTPTPTPEPTPTPTPEPKPAYFTYTIQPGDTIASITAAFGISPEYVLWNNPELGDDPDFVIAGQEILIPGTDGIIYSVKLGDTLSDIAAFYGISVQSIVDFVPNGLASADDVIEGMTLLLPGATPPPPPPPPPTPTPTPAPPVVTIDPPATPEPTPLPLPAPLVWPFVGPITSYFGEDRGGGVYHQGIDIEGLGQEGAPVVAAAAGQVVLAESHPGYGNYVILSHPDGSETLYGHLSEIYVAYGQFVDQGEVVGGLGHSGYVIGSDGNHVHFELRIAGIPVDPLPYLP